MRKPVAIVLGPDRGAVSGVSTHLNLLFGSDLARDFELVHFQVGSEGRRECAWRIPLRLATSPVRLARAILANGAALVHVNTSLEPRAYWRDLLYVATAKLCGAKVLYQVHGGALPREFFPRSRALTALLRATLALPDVVVVLAGCELRAYREFLPRQRVLVIPNAIDFAPYAQLARPARAEPQSQSEPLNLLYVGRLAREKGLFEAVEALRLAVEAGLRVRLVIAGSGPDEAALRQTVDALRLGGIVTFAGAVFGERKLELLAAADVFLFPTYHREGLPYALLESMAAGTPVISTRVGGIPDVMTHGVHGLLVPPHNPLAVLGAVRTLAEDRRLLARMGDAARRRIAGGFSIERLYGDFAYVYRELCGSAPMGALKRS